MMPNFLTEGEQAAYDEPLDMTVEPVDVDEEEEEESEDESEAEEQSETAEPDPADKDEDEAGETKDETDSEIDGIKFKAIIAKDGSHTIPIEVLQQLRQQNAELKAQVATAGAAKPAVVEDEWKDLREMTAIERAEYALESDENAERVEKFVVVKHSEQTFEAEAKEVVQGFIKDHEDLMADPVYYGAIQRSFDAQLDAGASPKAAMIAAEKAVNERLGIGKPAAAQPQAPRNPARQIKSLAGGPGSGANRDTSSPDLDSPDESVVVKAYSAMSEAERAQYRLTGSPR